MSGANNQKIIGPPENFWLWHPLQGFDLTHPDTPDSPPVVPRVGLQTTTSPLIIAPDKTALVIIDTQNFFLSKSLGRSGSGHAAETALLDHGIPAARKAGIQIIWLTWGLSDSDLETASPTTLRIWGFDGHKQQEVQLVTQLSHETAPHRRTVIVETELESGGDIGSDLGPIKLLNGKTVPGGRLLMRDQWNTALHAPLEQAFQAGQKLLVKPDVRFHKNRLSGLCNTMVDCEQFLRANGLRTLLFAGVNTDQCVLATIQDANLKGFDTILLQDGCATNSPDGAQSSTEYNCEKSWGFMSSCKMLAEALT